jgi:hypothetical protein
MSERFTVPVEFRLLDDVEREGHLAVTALRAQLDDAHVSEPDDRGAFYVELEAEDQDDANTKVWHAADQARVSGFLDFVGRRTT